MKEMSLREKIGQRLVVGFPGFEMTKEYIELVREYKVGNVILFAENVESALQLKTLCDSIQELTKAQTGLQAQPLGLGLLCGRWSYHRLPERSGHRR